MKSQEEIEIKEGELSKKLNVVLSKARANVPANDLNYFEDGILCGKISALRWVLGGHWDFFFENKSL